MKSIIKLGLISILAIGAASCQPGSEKKTDEVAAQEVKVYPVKVEKIVNKSLSRTLDYSANLTAFKEIHYAPASPGRIDKINVEVGDRVRKGQILVETDKTQLSAAKTQLESAKDSYNRIKTLYDQGSMAEQTYEQTKTQLELAQKNVDFLIENTTLQSPINGIITGKYFEDGEMFSGAPNTQAGKAAIISLMQINPLKAMVSISQAHYPEVKQGMKVQITTDVIPGKEFEGKITMVHPTINPMTRTFQVEVVIPNSDEILRPGMFANIKIAVQEDEAMMLPSYAVLKQPGTNTRYVFVNNNGKAKQINVVMGKRVNDQVEVVSDQLKVGMDLIIDGQASLLDGSDIKIVK